MNIRYPLSRCAVALCALALLLAAACSRPKDRFLLEGRLAGVNQAEFFIYCDDGNAPFFDTISIRDGSFSYERQLAAPAVMTLLYPNFSQTYIVAEPGKKLRIEGDASRLAEADISGTEDNELLSTFRRENAGKRETEVRLAAGEFIRSHAATLAAYAVFKRYFATDKAPDPATTRSLLADLRKAQPDNAALHALADRLEPRLSAAEGQQLPDFEAQTIDGRTVTKADFEGRPLLVACWASWSNESTALIQKVRRLQRAYGKRLGTLSVSLDADPVRCRRRAERDSLGGPIVCDTRTFDGPLVRRLGLGQVPGTLLVDEKGKIVQRDIPIDDLERRIADVMPAQ